MVVGRRIFLVFSLEACDVLVLDVTEHLQVR